MNLIFVVLIKDLTELKVCRIFKSYTKLKAKDAHPIGIGWYVVKGSDPPRRASYNDAE